LHESIKPKGDLESLSNEEIVDIIKEAGIVGLGGASFPTHVKMIASEEAGVDTVILTGSECEPYLTCDHRTMLEKSDLVVYGMEVLMRYFNGEKGYIGIEDNKMDAIEKMDEVLRGKDKLETANLKAKFPQGDSYRMIDSILGRIVPQGGRCKDVGVIVNNVGTAVAIAEAILDGKPLYERVITVS